MSRLRALALVAGSLASLTFVALAQDKPQPPVPPGASPKDAEKEKPDYPPFKEISEGYEKVAVSSGEEPFFNIWQRKKDNQLIAELPRGYQNQKHMFSMTLPTGEIFAGLQAGSIYGYWKQIDKRLAFITPQIAVRSTGDMESKDSLQNHFTDRVVFDVPILCMGPTGQPVIDLDALLVGQLPIFYGYSGAGAKPQLATLKEVKSFPENFVTAFEVPVAGGVLKTFHYSISLLPENPSYHPRVADNRVGFFYTFFRDLGKFRNDEVWTRYINRWQLEKADPKLKLSPPKKPIVYYVEYTVPVRYRRYVRDGALAWNKAFEKIGIKDAVEVYYQDKSTGTHMDKDPEDIRYSFIRWLANDIGTAIGPSRPNPMTGQILNAGVLLTDGWIRHFWYQSNEFLPQQAMEGMSAETISWLAHRPQWDPRVLLAPPQQRDQVMRDIAQQNAMLSSRAGVSAFGGMPVPAGDLAVLGRPEYKNLLGELPGNSLFCMAAEGKSRDMALMGLSLDVMGMLDDEKNAAEGKKDDKDAEAKKEPKADDSDKIDGIPEWFLGPALADLTMHEVGHTLGLRHNFRASSIYGLKQVNSKEWKEQGKPIAGSVMDYIPVNINMNDGEVQGPYEMLGVGPYDMWAIEYGYTFDDPEKVAKRAGEPELTYATDEDTGGCDPLARRYDFAADPRDYAQSRMRLAKFLRERIVDKFVKDGESWAKARRGYQITLSTQMDAVNIMSTWLGGSFINRDKKGDPGNRAPIAVIPAEQQRAALKFVVENAFTDEAFGITPELLSRLTVDKWWDGGGQAESEPTFPIHDRIIGIQSSALTLLMNPSTLRRVYDNEALSAADKDAVTLPEVLNTVTSAIWSELDKSEGGRFTNRQPMVSSLRRNLQREHLDRLIDLSLTGASNDGASGRPIATLATAKLRELEGKIGKTLDANKSRLDDYSSAHLSEAKLRISKALDAHYTYNPSGDNSFPWFLLMGKGTDDNRNQPMKSGSGE
jgi:hypothetical protein